jgi:hypothetical protein
MRPAAKLEKSGWGTDEGRRGWSLSSWLSLVFALVAAMASADLSLATPSILSL